MPTPREKRARAAGERFRISEPEEKSVPNLFSDSEEENRPAVVNEGADPLEGSRNRAESISSLKAFNQEVGMAAEGKGYWADPMAGTEAHERGYDLELRAKLAIEYVEKWGMVQGVDGGEDSSGRAKLALMSVEETVSRAVTMADHLVSVLEQRGWIAHPSDDAEAMARRAGKLAAIRMEAEHELWRERRERPDVK